MLTGDCRYCHLAFGPAALQNDASGTGHMPHGGTSQAQKTSASLRVF